MSIDKWLSKGNSKEEQEKIEKAYNALSDEKVQNLKKKSIQELTKKNEMNKSEDFNHKSFLHDILEFKDWLNQRTFLKGDLDQIETWINNLSRKLNLEQEINRKETIKTNRSQLIEEFRKIPPRFIDEKIRVAINKKLHGKKRTNSDNYYLRKLKDRIKEKLHEANYYEILKKIVEL